ncbi:MAG TPA: flavin reductase family protein [Gemmatimonadales bacterium]|nr:flavin reductase family protein [Gemmatimonadales bacterium]
MRDVDAPEFRQLLGRFATGVVVITVVGSDGRLHGMTANSLASVSLDPPLVSVCVDHRAELHPIITKSDRFVANVLASNQEALSRRFADPHDDRFDGVGYQLSPEGGVLLDGALAHIECLIFAMHEAGDHTIVVGRVVGGSAGEGRPLLYYRGGYAALA